MKPAVFLVTFCLLHLGIFSHQSLSGQADSSPASGSALDSLLLAGNGEAFASFWQHASPAWVALNVPPDRATAYGELCKRLLSLAGASEEQARNVCLEFEGSEWKFNARYAGEKAEAAHQRFVKARSEARWKGALEEYYIAEHFRSQHLRDNRRRLERNLANAETLFTAGKYAEVVQAAKAFDAEDPADPAFRIVRDSLAPLYAALQSRALDRLAKEQQEREAEVVTKRLAVILGVGMSSYAQQQAHQSILRFQDLEFDPEPAPGSLEAFYALQLDYFLSPALSLGLQARTGSVYDAEVFAEPFGTPSPARIHIQVDDFSIVAGGKAFFTEKTGLRPFLRLAAGVVSVRRRGTDMQSAKWAALGVHARLEESKASYPMVVMEFGCDYEPSTHLPFFLGGHVSLSNHFGDSSLIRHYVGSAEVCIGYNVL